MEEVILVDEHDQEIGRGEKIQTHSEGALHRAFSIFLFNDKALLLLQKRARAKYHSGELWSNTCCGHPRPGESTASAARRRLREEMNIDCDLEQTFSFIYRVDVGNQLSEYEYDHVFFGRFNGDPRPDPREVEGWKWIDMNTLARELKSNPEGYTYWLGIAFNRLCEALIGTNKEKWEITLNRYLPEK